MVRFLPLLFLAVLISACLSASDTPPATDIDGLGRIYFANSGAPEAQDSFYRGVLLLHSFEFGRARQEFKEAIAADSTFFMAYWGEAMTFNYPLWRQTWPADAQEVLAKLAPTPAERRALAPTDREAMYMDAVEALFGEGDKTERDAAYSEAMGRLHEAWPDDDEARAFYALSILGLTNGERDYDTYGRAGRLAEPLFERNPRHPGAAHYIIHAYDDPDHARQGLAAAEAYADIAPGAGHAQHMTTHIFLALGMWDRVIENNILATATTVAQRGDMNPAPWACGHYTSWEHYGHLQLGQFEDAERLMDNCYAWITTTEPSGTQWEYYSSMRAHHVLEAGDTSLLDRWSQGVPEGRSATASAGWPDNSARIEGVNALVRMRAGEQVALDPVLAAIADEPVGNHIMKLQLEGLAAIQSGQTDRGLTLIREAADLEDALPVEFGPPEQPMPSRELLASELLRAGRVAEADTALQQTEARTPGRRTARSIAQAIADHGEQ